MPDKGNERLTHAAAARVEGAEGGGEAEEQRMALRKCDNFKSKTKRTTIIKTTTENCQFILL